MFYDVKKKAKKFSHYEDFFSHYKYWLSADIKDFFKFSFKIELPLQSSTAHLKFVLKKNEFITSLANLKMNIHFHTVHL